MPVFTKASVHAGQGSPRAGKVAAPWFAAALLAAIFSLAAALLFGGAAAARMLLDPGPLVRWGLPAAQMVNNLSVALVVGSLVFAAGILPRHRTARLRFTGRHDQPPAEHPAFSRVLAVAGVAAVVWTFSAITVLLMSYLDQAGLQLSADPEFTQGLVYFMTGLAYGQAWLTVTILAAVVTTLCFGLRSRTGLGFTLLLTLSALVPQALIGHSASSPDHEGAVGSLLLHIAGAALWLGGIAVLSLISGRIAASGELTAQVLRRFSALALFAFCLVLASGVVNAAIRLTSWDMLLGSAYGQLILLKMMATLILGGLGFMHRNWIIPQLEQGSQQGSQSIRRVLWQFIGVELVILAATSGIAVGLGRSAPPQPTGYAPDTSPAEILSGYPLPPELNFERWFTEWRMDWLWLALVITAAVSYLLGVRKLSRCRERWSRLRTLSWLLGLAGLFFLTSGGPAVYGKVLFSAYLTGQLALITLVPAFLVLGAPVSLALKALAPRDDDSCGAREWIILVMHSKPVAALTHPWGAAGNLLVGLAVFYLSPLFGLALRSQVGRELAILYLVTSGCFFAFSLMRQGTDTALSRSGPIHRLIPLLLVMILSVAAGFVLMSSEVLLEASYFGNLGRDWGPSAIADQQSAGVRGGAVGLSGLALLAVLLIITWSRSHRRRDSDRTVPATDRNRNITPAE